MIVSIVGLGSQMAFAQSDLSCPSCVRILEHEIELYKELFPLIIWTDYQIYDHNSIITVNGFLRPENAVSPITATVTNPIGNIVTVEQLSPTPTGNFSFDLNTSGTTWKKDGDYIIKVKSGSDSRQFKTKVTLVSYEIGDRHTCETNEIPVNANNGGIYCIPFKINKGHATGVESTLDVTTKTLSVYVRGNDISNIILDIPRSLLDSKTTAGEDSSFVIMSNDKIISYEELESDSDSRTIKLDYSPTRKGEFQIIGTHVVPEFGTIVLIVLLISISSIILFGRTFSSKLLTH